MPSVISTMEDAKVRIKALIEECYWRFDKEPGDELIFVGKYESFTKEELSFLFEEKITVLFDNIYYTPNSSNVHEKAADNIELCFRNADYKGNDVANLGPKKIPINPIYSCGKLHYKIPDFRFCTSTNKNVLVGEIAFSHETIEEAIFISMNYLTEYTSINCVVYFLTNYDTENFSGYIFVLGRNFSLDQDKIDELKEAAVNVQPQLISSKCINVKEHVKHQALTIKNVTLTSDTNNTYLDVNFFAQHGIELLFQRHISQSNLNQSFIVRLRGSDVGFPSLEYVNVQISSECIYEIYVEWCIWATNRRLRS